MTIPNEAVEAAAFAFYGKHLCTDPVCWGYEYERSEIRSALEAALPAIEKEIRAQVAAELRGELPVQLAETAGSDTGWLSGMQRCDPEVGGDTEWVSFFDDNANDIGSIDLYHIAEHAADIAERSGK